MGLNLAQELTRVDHIPLFLVFLDLSKAYVTIDRERIILTLEGYGAGPRLCVLLDTLWSHQQMVLRQNGFHRPDFPVTQGTTQGGLVYLTLFNVVVENFIRTWLSMTVEDRMVSHDGMGESVVWYLEIFYANYGMVSSIEEEWLY